MCGEKGATRLNAARPVGSPPRVRGKARSAARSLISTGITPACAGKRACRCRSRRDTRDHPRVCGEKSDPARCTVHRRGSPPRVRGKERQDGTFASASGITPACAGKSIASPFSFTLLQDHPRVCGEKPFLAAELALMTGSPPRVRGKAFMKRYFSSYGGITPACAGKSHTLRFRIPRHRDHPRVCGEKE